MPPARENELATFNSRAGVRSLGATRTYLHSRTTGMWVVNDAKHRGCNEVMAQRQGYLCVTTSWTCHHWQRALFAP
jgi:hypothetical protein